MRRIFILVAALGFVLVPLGSAESSYSDAAGDSGTAPDITAITVSNTDEGVVTFRVSANLVPQTGLGAALDTDLDVNTSSGKYTILVSMMPSGSLVAAVLDFHGAKPPGVALVATAVEGVVEFSFQKEPLGIDAAVAFHLYTFTLFPSVSGDRAPDGNAAWHYVLSEPAPPPAPVVKPVVGKPLATPARPVAGKRFVVAFPVTRSDDGAPFVNGALSCTTKVAGKVVPHRHTFKTGQARVTLTLPKTARGKQLRIAVKVTADEQAATKIFTFTIR